jgi:hypothetical protein
VNAPTTAPLVCPLPTCEAWRPNPGRRLRHWPASGTAQLARPRVVIRRASP